MTLWAAGLVAAALPESRLRAGDPAASKPDDGPIQVAFSGSMFVDVNENDASAAVRVWAQMLSKEHGIPVNQTVRILRGTNAIAAALQSHTADIITLTTEEYWALRKDVPFGSFA